MPEPAKPSLPRRALGALLPGAEEARVGRELFVRGVALCFLVSFLDLRAQLPGLIGDRGILPVREFMAAAGAALGEGAAWRLPTLVWLDPSPDGVSRLCLAGAAAAALALAGLLPAPALALCWALYLSVSLAFQDFTSFQWDLLLLQCGILAVFLAPWTARSRPADAPAPAPLAMFWGRVVLFQLMFQSGCVKLRSHDPTWADLSALTFHYQTQPIPDRLGWWMHQAPAWFHRASCAAMFGIELGLPFLVFGPRPLRRLAAAGLALLQVLIAATGNYGIFNLLTLVLCCLLLDDRLFGREPGPAPAPPASALETRLKPPLLLAAALVGLLASASHLAHTLDLTLPGAARLDALVDRLDPLRSFNSYGLFAVMTTTRPEIEIEGSADGTTWKPYVFRYKAGPLTRAPPFCAPSMPRLDWQMWFAALGGPRRHSWVMSLFARLLTGSPEVADLLETNPFPDASPRFLRTTVYEYSFTDPATRDATGRWWTRRPQGSFMPVLSLR